VLLCQQPDDAAPGQRGFSLVVVEGGPKVHALRVYALPQCLPSHLLSPAPPACPQGLKKFVHLMLKRVPWDVKSEPSTSREAWAKEEEDEDDEEDDDEEDDEEDEEDGEGGKGKAGEGDGAAAPSSSSSSSSSAAPAAFDAAAPAATATSASANACHLVWQGTLAKRSFTGFKFQECRSLAAARRVMESKAVPHYWDMCLNL
jgi:hypothetical protein